MARIKFSAIGITNIIGKAGGTVFSRNRGGAYIKNFVMPSNPTSPRQMYVRALFAMLSSGWRALSQDVRNAWDAARENYPTTNVFGDTLILSGKALYQKLNGNLINAGMTQLTLPLEPKGAIPPIGVTDPEVNSVLGVLQTVTTELDFSENVTGVVVIDATRPMSPGRSAQPTDFRRIVAVSVTATDTVSKSMVDEYVLVHGEAGEVGSVIHFRASLVVQTGEMSAPFIYSTSVVSGA